MIDTLEDMLPEGTPYFVNPDFSDAVIGLTYEGGVVYDYDIMVDSLAKTDGMNEEDAAEFIDYNTARTIPYMDDPKPVIIRRFGGKE